MKPKVRNVVCLILATLAAALISASCDFFFDWGTPIFAGTDLMEASYSGGQFTYAPHYDVEYIVLGIFDNAITTSGKSIMNMSDMRGGSCTGLAGFTRGQVAEASLYVYTDASKSFTGSQGGYNPVGTKYWALWGFNTDWMIISSSKQTTTNFP